MSYLLFRKKKFVGERFSLAEVKEALEAEPELRVLNSHRPLPEIEAQVRSGETFKLICSSTLRGLSLRETQELERL